MKIDDNKIIIQILMPNVFTIFHLGLNKIEFRSSMKPAKNVEIDKSPTDISQTRTHIHSKISQKR